MIRYKVNLKFKESGKSLNQTLYEVLKIEIEKNATTQDDLLFLNRREK